MARVIPALLAAIKFYIWNILIALDQVGNALTFGDPGETLSSRAAKNMHVLGWHILGRILEAVDPGHLKDSLQLDEGKNSVLERLRRAGYLEQKQ